MGNVMKLQQVAVILKCPPALQKLFTETQKHKKLDWKIQPPAQSQSIT